MTEPTAHSRQQQQSSERRYLLIVDPPNGLPMSVVRQRSIFGPLTLEQHVRAAACPTPHPTAPAAQPSPAHTI